MYELIREHHKTLIEEDRKLSAKMKVIECIDFFLAEKKDNYYILGKLLEMKRECKNCLIDNYDKYEVLLLSYQIEFILEMIEEILNVISLDVL